MTISADRSRVFLDIDIAGRAAGRLVVELFADKTPLTCENFRQLCTGEHDSLSYKGTPFHRVIDEFMVQGGDILKGDGTGITSIYGKQFDDENLEWRELDAAYLVCSANRGKNTNGSQFFITLAPSPHLNGRHTIFGRLVSGQDILDNIAKVQVDEDDKPTEPITISRCGELERRIKKPASTKDRGRARDEEESHAAKLDAPAETATRKRRPSDNVRDEGLRGRPRKRSKTRTDDSAIEEDGPSDISPVKIHKRRRSPSPGPAQSSEDGDSYERRRRRSLPNQYQERRGDDHRAKRYHDRRHDYQDSSHSHRYHRDDQSHEHRYHRDDAAYGQQRHERYGDGRIQQDSSGTMDGVKFKGRGTMKYREPGRFYLQ